MGEILSNTADPTATIHVPVTAVCARVLAALSGNVPCSPDGSRGC
ncbi:hypothetical protein [Streptomyces kaniharaensis]|nr:hypothetical protein [Streptomyces kaniharaensis]